MTTKNIDIPFPFQGISDIASPRNQPPVTTRDAVNVRGVDPTTGRETGAQRAGLEKFTNTQLAAAPVRDLATVTFDSRQTTYTAIDDANDIVVKWSTAVPAKDESQRVILDRKGDVYALSGFNGIVKYNSAGVEITHFEVPLDHPDQRVRALAVDELGNIFCSTWFGPQGAAPLIYRFTIDSEGAYQLAWTHEVEGYARDIAYRNDKLYTVVNVAERVLPSGNPSDAFGQAFLVVFDSLSGSAPREIWRRSVPFPASQIRVNTEGESFVGSFANPQRGVTFGRPFSTKSIDWRPDDVDPGDSEVWAWLDAADLHDEGLTDGDDVTFWPDKSGNGRNLFHPGNSSTTPSFGNTIVPPTFRAAGLAEEPIVRFNLSHGLSTFDTSNTNAENVLDSNLSLIASVQGHAWTIAFLIAPKVDDDSKTFFYQNGEVLIRLAADEDEDQTGLKGVIGSEIAPISDAAPVLITSGDYVDEAEATLRNDVAIVVLRHGGDDATEKSKWRINGAVTESFTINRDQIRYASFIGFNPVAGETNHFDGDIAEIVTFRDTSAKSDATILAEMEMLEGYLAHKYGVQHQLESGHTYETVPPGGGSGAPAPPSDDVLALSSQDGVIAKFKSNKGDLAWAFDGAGVGVTVALDEDGDVYNVGDTVASPSDTTTIRKIVDDGASFTLDWTLTSTSYPENGFIVYMEVDGEKNLYAPNHKPGGPSAGDEALYKIDVTGTIEWKYSSTPARVGYDVALGPTRDYNDATIGEPEFLYFVHFNGENPEEHTLEKLCLVSAVVNDGSPRDFVHLGVANGDIRIMEPGEPTDVRTPTGGSGALDSSSPFIQSATLFGQIFIIDGEKVVVYDPVADEVVDYIPTSSGELPPRPKLIAPWRGALVFARFDGDAHNWFITRRTDPFDVDVSPPVIDELQAVIGNDSRPGVVPDIINALIPISDDLLIFGGDHSIHRMTGDPMAGGVIDLVTDITGIAFGRAWCKDDLGILYFAGADSGVYRMLPGGLPELISLDTARGISVEERIRDIDQTTKLIKLAWDSRNQGVVLSIVPRGAPSATATKHFFWERRGARWWEDKYSDGDHEPYSMLSVDNDLPDDRHLIIGNADGFVRKVVPTAKDDDGEPIDSKVVIGPIYDPTPARRLKLSRFRLVFAEDQDGAWAEILVSDTVTRIPEVGEKIYINKNDNSWHYLRARGQYIWLKISSRQLSKRWAFESASAEISTAGRL